MRPEVGTQAQFKKKKPPKTYHYDSSLSPTLVWDAKSPTREQGEALIKQILDADKLEEANKGKWGQSRLNESRMPSLIRNSILIESDRMPSSAVCLAG